ncbi:MAG: GNAT family N-acetyltransferase [Chloroflexi bacterium]|nr:GNAT family N-acetyltransferase [Chloroflexota bacterium]
MSDAAEIRNFTWNDFDSVFDTRAAVTGIPAADVDEERSHFRARLELPGADPLDNVFVAEQSGAVVGCAIAAVEPAIGRVVGEFGVLEGARGQGVGDPHPTRRIDRLQRLAGTGPRRQEKTDR